MYIVLMFQIESNFYTVVPCQAWFCQLMIPSTSGFPYVLSGFANHSIRFHVSMIFNFCTHKKYL
jgi:hypothetical protein